MFKVVLICLENWKISSWLPAKLPSHKIRMAFLFVTMFEWKLVGLSLYYSASLVTSWHWMTMSLLLVTGIQSNWRQSVWLSPHRPGMSQQVTPPQLTMGGICPTFACTVIRRHAEFLTAISAQPSWDCKCFTRCKLWKHSWQISLQSLLLGEASTQKGGKRMSSSTSLQCWQRCSSLKLP